MKFQGISLLLSSTLSGGEVCFQCQTWSSLWSLKFNVAWAEWSFCSILNRVLPDFTLILNTQIHLIEWISDFNKTFAQRTGGFRSLNASALGFQDVPQRAKPLRQGPLSDWLHLLRYIWLNIYHRFQNNFCTKERETSVIECTHLGVSKCLTESQASETGSTFHLTAFTHMNLIEYIRDFNKTFAQKKRGLQSLNASIWGFEDVLQRAKPQRQGPKTGWCQWCDCC